METALVSLDKNAILTSEFNVRGHAHAGIKDF